MPEERSIQNSVSGLDTFLRSLGGEEYRFKNFKKVVDGLARGSRGKASSKDLKVLGEQRETLQDAGVVIDTSSDKVILSDRYQADFPLWGRLIKALSAFEDFIEPGNVENNYMKNKIIEHGGKPGTPFSDAGEIKEIDLSTKAQLEITRFLASLYEKAHAEGDKDPLGSINSIYDDMTSLLMEKYSNNNDSVTSYFRAYFAGIRTTMRAYDYLKKKGNDVIVPSQVATDRSGADLIAIDSQKEIFLTQVKTSHSGELLDEIDMEGQKSPLFSLKNEFLRKLNKQKVSRSVEEEFKVSIGERDISGVKTRWIEI